ncbi:unnamed protein product [Rotaria sp. Silwood1]|nr:unnamed protein product [Rotaria sp. Silwood1]CAF4892480.1 unnamed protein product [Rotaria sp. Silwood1]
MFIKTTGNNAITLERYQQIRLGWTRDQVTQFVGSPGELIIPEEPISPSNRGNIMVQYQGSILSNVLERESTVIFSFNNGILWKKNQKLLDLTSNYIITRERYNQIQAGWTYDQVRSTIGSRGNVIQEANIWPNITLMTVLYQGEGQEGVESIGYIQLGFWDGKLQSKPGYEWVAVSPTIRSSTHISRTNALLPNDRITFQQYQQIQFGWIHDQLTQYVGSPGQVMPSIANNPDTILVQYQGSSSSIIAIAGFRFVNGILSIKAQFNFDFTTNYKITKEQYNMITIGWTYQQVTVAF